MSPLARRVVATLLRKGGWMMRAHLAHLSSSTLALDEALADLVTEQVLEFQRAAGYRVRLDYRKSGGPLMVRALEQLDAEPDSLRAVVGAELPCEDGDHLVLGVAERRPELGAGGAVSYLVELPTGSPSERLAQAMAVLQAFPSQGVPRAA